MKKLSTILVFAISIFCFSILTFILPLFSILNLLKFLSFPMASGITAIYSTDFSTIFTISSALTITTLLFFIFNVIIASYERDYKVAVLALTGVVTCIGIALYLSQGIYLFAFQPGWTATRYLILQIDLLAFFALNVFAVLLFEIPNLLKFISFVITYRRYIFLR